MKPVQHPYCYKGTDVLKNKEGLRDAAALERLERTASGLRMLTLKQKPMTAAGYRAVHRHLFQDVYTWAGHYRIVDTGRGAAPFCLAAHIPTNMEKSFATLASQNFLKGSTAEEFARLAAEHINELNAIHPFVDGNGRTNRAFLKSLAEQAAHHIQLARIDAADWNKASALGFYRADHALMSEIIFDCIVGS